MGRYFSNKAMWVSIKHPDLEVRHSGCVIYQLGGLRSESESCLVVSNSAIRWTVCSLPGSSVHGILWARILEWVAMPGGLPPGDLPHPGTDSFSSELPGKSRRG